MKILENDGLRFDCRSEAELWRARTLLTKEPGTIAWLKDELREGDVFYDIGANVGCYTLFAARLVGERGHVYAFEPHPANLAALLRNVALNGLVRDRISIVTAPLASGARLGAFSLASLEAGTSGHTSTVFQGVIVAMTSIDLLLERLKLTPPTVIKIDVDGDELSILQGMAETVKMGETVRTLQVESAPSVRPQLEHFIRFCGYTKTGAHYTKQCQEQLDAGIPATQVIENAIFQRAA